MSWYVRVLSEQARFKMIWIDRLSIAYFGADRCEPQPAPTVLGFGSELQPASPQPRWQQDTHC